MERLIYLSSKCKGGIILTIDGHKGCCTTIDKYINTPEFCGCKDGDIEDWIKDKIIELNTIVELQFYPDSPIGFYKIYHYDIEMAVDNAIKIINN